MQIETESEGDLFGAVQAPSPQEWVARLSGYEGEICQLEERLDALENQPFDQALPDLIPALHDLSYRATASLERMLDSYDGREGEAESLVGLIFFALHELRKRQDRLLRLAAKSLDLALIAECGGLLRNLKRALAAVQALMSKIEGLPPKEAPVRDLHLALEVRSAYAKFRGEIVQIAGRNRAEPQFAGAALQSAATSIAKLIGRDIFTGLRLTDRIELRALQRRILAWRTAGGDPIEAQRLWQDLYGYVQLLQKVNLRQELLEHDRAVLAQIEELAGAADSSAPGLEPALRRRAATLVGRDDALDALLHGQPSATQLLAVLRALRGQLQSAGIEASAVEENPASDEHSLRQRDLISISGRNLT